MPSAVRHSFPIEYCLIDIKNFAVCIHSLIIFSSALRITISCLCISHGSLTTHFSIMQTMVPFKSLKPLFTSTKSFSFRALTLFTFWILIQVSISELLPCSLFESLYKLLAFSWMIVVFSSKLHWFWSSIQILHNLSRFSISSLLWQVSFIAHKGITTWELAFILSIIMYCSHNSHSKPWFFQNLAKFFIASNCLHTPCS